MALYPVLHFPDPRLQQKAETVENIADAKIQTLIDDMFETMYANRGVGLAATQVGIPLRIAVIDFSEDKSGQMVLINPEIIAMEDEVKMQEACLSVPNYHDMVKRANRATIRAFDRHGKVYEHTGEGVLAQCFQHELGHLNGQLYIDTLSPLKREFAIKKIKKQHRHCDTC